MADTDLDVENITKPFAPLEALLTAPSGSNRPPLWDAWNQLQVYANWGVRLPTKTTDFVAVMGKSPAGFDFFPPMKEGNTIIRDGCKAFLVNGYGKIVSVGHTLRSYMKDVSDTDGGTAKFISDMIKEGDMETALDILNDMQNDAQSAYDEAGEAKEGLDAFSVALSEATGRLTDANTSLDTDAKTNKDEIAKLEGDADEVGSIKNLQKQFDAAKADYDHYVVVAATSPTYVWVAPPVGLIATATVAGIYGKKAVETLELMDSLEDQIKNKNKEVSAAKAARDIYGLADKGLENVIKYTAVASENIGMVQQAWDGILAQVKTLKKNVDKTTELNESGEEVIRRKKVMERYLDKMDKTYTALIPDLNELLTDNYITVEPGTLSLADAAKKIKAEIPG